MKTIRQKSDYENRGKDLKSYPSQYDNKDYGQKRKAHTHNVVLKNTKTGQVFGYKTVEETMKFSEYLINEADASKDTRLPTSVVGEITSLIRKGAKDLEQGWKNAFELVHTAYHVANVKRPTPDQKGAWKQYEDLLRVAVKALADTRGLSGRWRVSQTAFAEGMKTPELDQILAEAHSSNRKHRIFVRTKSIGFDDQEKEFEVDAGSLDEVIQSFMSQAKRNGRHVRIEPISQNQVKLVVYVKGVTKTRDEQIIQLKDWSV
jgi:hypothetical protein